MYLLDNNVISEIRKIKKNAANKNVTLWFEAVDMTNLYTCQIVMMEIERGVLLKQRKDSLQGEHLAHWFYQGVKPMFAGRILTINDEIASICAKLHVPNPRPESDYWIAATAIYHGFILVTRNVGDFENLPLQIFNPFEKSL